MSILSNGLRDAQITMIRLHSSRRVAHSLGRRTCAAAAASSKMSNHVMAIGAAAASAAAGRWALYCDLLYSSTLSLSLSLFLVRDFVPPCCMHVHAAAAAPLLGPPLCAYSITMDKINWTMARARTRGDYPHEGVGKFRTISLRVLHYC